MSLQATYEYFPLKFKKPAGTSRGFLTEKPSWLLRIRDLVSNVEGIGECSIIPGLSIDPENEIEAKLEEICKAISKSNSLDLNDIALRDFPAVKFALETAVLDLNGGGKRILFDNAFSKGEKGIRINGLVWMSDTEEMFLQARDKIDSGFNCLKFKVGALDFDSEVALLERVRNELDPEIEIRLDANGAFNPGEALDKLKILSAYKIHSIEQPIKPGHWEQMAELCKQSPIPIALDEELIGLDNVSAAEMLEMIQPQYVILKPSLLGGFSACDHWIQMADDQNIGWWATSALESNIGLNAIAQWAASKNPILPQGLGTGSLYLENFPLPLEIKNGELWFNRKG